MSTHTKNQRGKGSDKQPALSRTRKPEGMSLEQWQRELRRQFGAKQNFRLEKIGDEPIFSEFYVFNPASGRTYQVNVRGQEPGVNFCTCADYVTNTLGTCKHIEFTLAALERKRGGKKALREGYQPEFSEIFVQYGSQRAVQLRRGTALDAKFASLAGRYFDDEGRLTPAGVAQFDQFLAAAEQTGHEFRVHEGVYAFVAELRDAQRRREIIDAAFPAGVRSKEFHELLKVTLYPYQKEGALFAARSGRCLIGDEMGLGKTIQAIAASQIMAKHLGVERVLVICPTSLKHQWEREITRFTEHSAIVVGGTVQQRREQFLGGGFFKITNYDTVRRDRQAIADWGPDLIILDEAQRIKNWDTIAARTVKQLASPYAIVLTGTPIENRLTELVSIVQFVDQHRLGPTYQFLHNHQKTEVGTGKVVGYQRLDEVAKTLQPILIRRRKQEVLTELPERLEKRHFIPMTPQQMDLHEGFRSTVAQIVAKWQKFGFLREADQQRLMAALQCMRMSCNSTYLLDGETDFGLKVDAVAEQLDDIFEDAGAKAVIFSQWLRTHELLRRRLEPRGIGHVTFTGSVPAKKRKGLIDQFREDPACRVFLATDAGGVGLNLQHASTVINVDLPWNPAVLEQRIGRVHRLGQTQPVQVINFVAEGTIEHGMLSLLGFKQSLFSGVLDGGKSEVFLGGSRLTKFMETVQQATGAIPTPSPRDEADVDEPTHDEADTPTAAASNGRPPEPPTLAQPASAAAVNDPLGGLIENGLALLQQFAAVQAGRSGQSGAAGLQVVRDEATNETYLKLRLPEPDKLAKAMQALTALLGGLK